MKTIKVEEVYFTPKQLYTEAMKSEPLRALFGYMLWTGRINDTILGGAFSLVCDLENRKPDELYQLMSMTTKEKYREIVAIAQYALAGSMAKFAPSKRQLRGNYRRLQDLPVMNGVADS